MTTSHDPKRRALGRGLDALLPMAPSTPAGKAYGAGSVFLCAVDKIAPQKGQPRQIFDATRLAELAASIQEHGLIEPLVVRRAQGTQDRFEIIAGERRFRACQKAGMKEILVVVKDVGSKAAFELALIENIQREDLTAIELAESFRRLLDEGGYTQESLAARLGKDRSTIANSLRLLKLPAEVRKRVLAGELSEGHARAILGADSPARMIELAEKVVRGRLSVRATEALVRAAVRGKKPAKAEPGASPAIRDLEARFTRSLGTKVLVKDAGNKGEIVIPYADLDQLDRIIAKLVR